MQYCLYYKCGWVTPCTVKWAWLPVTLVTYQQKHHFLKAPPSSLSPPSPPLLSLSNHLFELGGTSPQSLWLSSLCKYKPVLPKQEARCRLTCASVGEGSDVCRGRLFDSFTCTTGRCVCPGREDLLKDCWVPTVGWKCTSSKVNNITLSATWKSPSHSGIHGEAGLCARILYSIIEVLGLMSLMQIWTKFYSQLGRPLPKVQMLSTSFENNHILLWAVCLKVISSLSDVFCTGMGCSFVF